MNYKRIYYQLIARGKARPDLVEYTERHRIVPGCMGGRYTKDNIVRLTPEEHFLAHQLLVKIYPKHSGLVSAAIRMSCSNDGSRVNNKLYGWIRRKMAEAMSERMKDKIPWNKGKKCPQLSQALKNNTNHKKGSIPWNKGKGYLMPRGSDHHAFGKTFSKKIRDKMSAARLGVEPVNKGQKGKFGWFTNEFEERYFEIEKAPAAWRRGRLKKLKN